MLRRVLLPLVLALFACKSDPVQTPPPDEDAGPTDTLPTTDTSACALPDAIDLGGFSSAYVPPKSGSIQQDKAFAFATLLESDPALLAALSNDTTVEAIRVDREARLRGAAAKCTTNVACYRAELGFTAEETKAIADALPIALASSLASLASTKLRPSGSFIVHATETDAALLSSAWTDAARDLDATFDAYAASLDGAALAALVADVSSAHPEALPFFRPLVLVDLAALAAQKRDEATRYEPLATGENAAALATLPQIDWKAYPYSVILVPGLGPDKLDFALSPGGAQRCDLAARRFRAKLAPFILVSGGHVHPDRTPYSEAMEMKKYLVSQKGIPASAILVDPHARHTTTNLRNAARQIVRYGIPADRPALVTSDRFQSIYIAVALDERCKNELGYLPYRVVKAVTPNDTCMMPNPLSLQVDGRDALDP